MIQKLRSFIRVWLNDVTPSESIVDSKKKWNKLAEENARYFIMSDFGEEIDETLFKQTGENDYRALVTDDALLQSRLAPFNSKTVLEIGCGIGRLTQGFVRDFGRVIGVDISDTMIERAKSRLGGHANAQFFATDGVSYPVPSESVDFIFSFIVFQHMPDRETIRKNFEEAARVLKPGGIMKVQLRGLPAGKKYWFYGPSFNARQAQKALAGLPFSIIKTEGEHKNYFWLWLEKR